MFCSFVHQLIGDSYRDNTSVDAIFCFVGCVWHKTIDDISEKECPKNISITYFYLLRSCNTTRRKIISASSFPRRYHVIDLLIAITCLYHLTRISYWIQACCPWTLVTTQVVDDNMLEKLKSDRYWGP